VEQGIVVSTAASPVGRIWQRSFLIGAVLLAFGIGEGVFLPPSSEGRYVLSIVQMGLMVVSRLYPRSSRANLVVNALGVHICGVDWSAAKFTLASSPWDPVALALLYFPANEFDRLRLAQDLEDAERLQCGYAGAAEAQASVQADQNQIMAQIGEDLPRVDASINVLIASGMSTPTLRSLAARGVNMPRDFRYGFVVTAFGAWVCVGVGVILASSPNPQECMDRSWQLEKTHFILILCAISLLWSAAFACLWLFFRAAIDERAYIMSAIGKLAVVDIAIGFLINVGYRTALDCDSRLMLWIARTILVCILSWLAVLLAGLGRLRVATIPCVGRLLVGAVYSG